MSESRLRIPLGDCCLVCEGFRQRVAGRPSLEVDGDLLWALEHSSWQPLAVTLEPLADGARVRPLPLERQSAFDAQRALDWRDDEVRIACLPAVRDAGHCSTGAGRAGRGRPSARRRSMPRLMPGAACCAWTAGAPGWPWPATSISCCPMPTLACTSATWPWTGDACASNQTPDAVI